jgi:hypothetical protein
MPDDFVARALDRFGATATGTGRRLPLGRRFRISRSQASWRIGRPKATKIHSSQADSSTDWSSPTREPTRVRGGALAHPSSAAFFATPPGEEHRPRR